jgi:hypothetical protein
VQAKPRRSLYAEHRDAQRSPTHAGRLQVTWESASVSPDFFPPLATAIEASVASSPVDASTVLPASGWQPLEQTAGSYADTTSWLLARSYHSLLVAQGLDQPVPYAAAPASDLNDVWHLQIANMAGWLSSGHPAGVLDNYWLRAECPKTRLSSYCPRSLLTRMPCNGHGQCITEDGCAPPPHACAACMLLRGRGARRRRACAGRRGCSACAIARRGGQGTGVT